MGSSKILQSLKRAMLLVVLALLPVTTSWAAQSAGMIKNVTGAASITRGTVTLPVSLGQRILAGDRIATSVGSYVGITLHDDTRMTIGPSSELVIQEFDFNASSYVGGLAVSFLKGTARVVTGLIARNTPDRARFTTPASTIGIRGTDFIVDLQVRD